MALSMKLLFSTLAAASFLGASLSHAETPVIFREVSEFDLELVDCTDFVVRTKGWEKDTFKIYPDRLVWKIQVTDSVYYNSADPEKFIQQGKNGIGENQTYVFYNNGDVKWAGAPFRITIPGIGHVLISTGNYYWDESEQSWVRHGLFFVLAEGETGLALCEALE